MKEEININNNFSKKIYFNENLSKYSEPDIAIITNIGTAHIGLLGSKKNITHAKCEICKFLNPEGVVIIPANDPFLEKTLIGII